MNYDVQQTMSLGPGTTSGPFKITPKRAAKSNVRVALNRFEEFREKK